MRVVPLRICIASKFPPIEGGIAARTYWRVLHLLERGDEVTLVTNADCVEAEHQIVGCEGHLSELTELYPLRIESLSTDVPWHIPASPDYLERLTSTLIRLLSTGDFETVESGFLIPFGIAAHLASQAS